jgi:predicted Zn-dependent protease with MMP-like domain
MSLPDALRPEPQPPRPGVRRDRHGRGMRGPTVLPGPLSPHGTGYPAGPARRFDDLVLSLVRPLQERWPEPLRDVEFGVEETPQLPWDWNPEEIPLATAVPASPSSPARIVLFRRPIEHRCADRTEASALVLDVLVEQVADLLGLDPAEVDPRDDF